MKSTTMYAILLLLLAIPLQAQFSDEFETDQLGSGWRLLREEPTRWRLQEDMLVLYTQPGALNGTLYNNVRNLLVQPCALDRQFTIETELTFDPAYDCRNAGILYYLDDDNYIRLSRGMYNGHDDIWLEWEVGGVPQFSYAGAPQPLTCQLKLEIISGRQFRAAWKTVNTAWTIFADQTVALPAMPIFVGLQAANGDGLAASQTPIPAMFQYFRIGGGVAVNSLAVPRQLTFGTPHPSPAAVGSDIAVPFMTDRVTPLRWHVTDILGREVLSPQGLGAFAPGKHILRLPLRISTPGVYLLHLECGSQRITRRILLTRHR